MPRIAFKKGESIKYISHLDLMRTFNRMFLRAEIPVKYSEGFNPHINLNFVLPLSVGVTSESDFCEISLSDNMSLSEVKERLVKAAPEGIEITDVTENYYPAFKEVAKASFEVEVFSDKTKNEFLNFLSLKEIITEKKTKKGIKEIDIKPMIFDFEIEDTNNGSVIIKLLLAAGNTTNLNPSLVIKAAQSYMNTEFDYVTYKRIALYTNDDVRF